MSDLKEEWSEEEKKTSNNSSIIPKSNIEEQQQKKKKRSFFEYHFDGEKGELSLKDAIINNIILGIIGLAIYFPVEVQRFELLNNQYYFHALLSFICFAVIPILYLCVFQLITGKAKYFFFATKKGLKPKKIISSLLQGVAMHAGIFYPWILLAQKYMPGVTKINYFLTKPSDWVLQIVFFAINVLMFEYYSKAFIQLQFAEAKGRINLFYGKVNIRGGKWLGFMLQNVAWLGGHVQEFLWLQDYLGVVNALFFIIVSGVLTGLTVLETENIFGVAIGHVLLNVFVLVTYAK